MHRYFGMRIFGWNSHQKGQICACFVQTTIAFSWEKGSSAHCKWFPVPRENNNNNFILFKCKHHLMKLSMQVMSPNKLRKTSIFLPPNMVHTNNLWQYILSCLVVLLLHIKINVINIINNNNNNMSSTTPSTTLILIGAGAGGKTVGTTRFNVLLKHLSRKIYLPIMPNLN